MELGTTTAQTFLIQNMWPQAAGTFWLGCSSDKHETASSKHKLVPPGPLWQVRDTKSRRTQLPHAQPHSAPSNLPSIGNGARFGSRHVESTWELALGTPHSLGHLGHLGHANVPPDDESAPRIRVTQVTQVSQVTQVTQNNPSVPSPPTCFKRSK